MRRKLPLFVLILVAGSLSSRAQVSNVWQVGLNDGGWPAGDGGGPNTSFLQENGAINALPGSPVTAVEGPQGADNDYYFSGVYSTVLPGVSSFYGAYTPVGVVAANDEGAERAFAGGDLDLRYHFNLTAANINSRLLSVTFEPLNLDDPNATNTDPRFGVEVYFNGVLVMPQLVIRPAQLNVAVTTPLFSPASVDARIGAVDNIVTLRGISYNGAPGGGNWMGFDYVQLDSQPVPEPSSAMMILCGALGVAPFLRRRR